MALPREPGKSTIAAITFLLLGSFAGFWIGGILGHHAEWHTADGELQLYANRLVADATVLSAEGDHIFNAVKNDGLPFCSEAEIDFMRGLVYRSSHVRDIGRTQGDTLVCASGVGKLAKPLVLDPPDISAGGVRVSVSRPLLIAKGATGFVIERSNVSIVLNPAVYAQLDEPPMLYTAWLYLRHDNLLLQSFGHPVPLTNAEILAGQPLLKHGVVYHPICSLRYSFCVAASEPLSAMKQAHGTVSWFRIFGGTLGGLLAAVVLLMFRNHRSMERQLRRAIANCSLTVEYQPVVNLCSGRITGAEALVRWVGEDGQAVRPELFVAIAEEKGFLTDITRLVVKTAVRELGDLLTTDHFRVTVNIARQDLEDSTFPDFLLTILRQHSVAPACLGLELTERSTANHEQAITAIARLKANGHAVYIDDFGTGYSSLSYLHQLEIDAIKIDQSFTQTVGTEAVTAPVVPQILAIARELDLLVVVEGIETRDQAAYFAAAGVRILGQGWYFGPSIPATELLERLRQQG